MFPRIAPIFATGCVCRRTDRERRILYRVVMKYQPVAKQQYEATSPGGSGSIVYSGSRDDETEWEHFSVQVSILDDMADDGLLKIVKWHEETDTGDRNIDRVDFIRDGAPSPATDALSHSSESGR
jgi:hypothetical protein